MFDHAQSPRLGQPVAPESPGIRMFDGDEIPEVSYTGQMIYRKDTQQIQVFNGDAWEEVVGGVIDRLTFVGDTAPDPAVGLHINDLWYDSSSNMALSIWNGTDWVAFIQETTPTFTGGVVTSDLVIQGGLSLQATANEIALESQLALAQGTVAPVIGPILVNDYDSVRLDITTQVGPGSFGNFALNLNEVVFLGWHKGSSTWLVAQQIPNAGARVFQFNPDGTLWFNSVTGKLGFFDIPSVERISGLFSFTGQTKMVYAGFLTTLSGPASQWIIYGRKPDGTWGTNRVPITVADGTTDFQKMIINVEDAVTGEYYLIEQKISSGNHVGIQRIRMSNTEGAFATRVGSRNLSDTGFSSTALFTGGTYGTQSGPTQLSFAAAGSLQSRQFTITSSTTSVQDDNYRFPFNGGVQLGFAHDGTNFYTLSLAGLLTKYTNWYWSDTSNPIRTWVGLSYYDSISTTHETDLGVKSDQLVVKRSRLSVTVPKITAGVGAEVPDTFKLYATTTTSGSTSAPATSAFKYQRNIGSTSATAKVVYRVPFTTSGASPSADPFPMGTAASLISAGQNVSGRQSFYLDGQGKGSWDAVAPPGSMTVWLGDQANPPYGWLLCDGTTKSQTTYSMLYAVIGTTFNTGGEGAGTFRLPTATRTVGSLTASYIVKY